MAQASPPEGKAHISFSEQQTFDNIPAVKDVCHGVMEF